MGRNPNIARAVGMEMSIAGASYAEATEAVETEYRDHADNCTKCGKCGSDAWFRVSVCAYICDSGHMLYKPTNEWK